MFAALSQKLYIPDRGDFKLSGNYSLAGAFLAMSLSTIVAGLAAYIYSLAVTVIPIIYFNFLLTVGLGVSIAYTVIFISKLSLIRNDKVRFFISVFVGILAFILQWLVYIFFLTTGKIPLEHTIAEGEFLLNPIVLKSILSKLYSYGNWSVFGFTVNGITLLLIWLGEALIIIGAPILILLKNPITPFSEKLHLWYPKVSLSQDFAYISGINSFIQELRTSKGSNLLNYPKGDGTRHSTISIYYLEQEDQSFLSADNIYITKGKESKKEVDPVVRFVAIPCTTANALIEKYGKKKWSYLNI